MLRFFFQAEDGIRDRTVTGVQTCALPICADLEAGKPIEGPFEDQMLERDGGIERVADDVRQPAVAFEPLCDLRRALWVDEKQHAQLFRLCPDWVEFRVGKLCAGDAPADGRSAQAELLDSFFELLNR